MRQLAFVFALVLVLVGCGDDPDRALQVIAATPDHGPLAGASTIELAGVGFTVGSTRVQIGGREAPFTSVVDDARLAVIIPPGDREGDAEVVVFTERGIARATGIFRYSAPPVIDEVMPANVLYSSASTLVTVRGSGFLADGAGDTQLAVAGHRVSDVDVVSDTLLTFTAPPGSVFSRPELELANDRGEATLQRAFHYVPSLRSGFLLFPSFTETFITFVDPTERTTVTIPRLEGTTPSRYTSVVRDRDGEYWALDRARRFGRIDLERQQLDTPLEIQTWWPAMAQVGEVDIVIDRSRFQLGRLDRVSGIVTPFGDAVPCCGSYGLAFDGTTLYLVYRDTSFPPDVAAGPPVTSSLFIATVDPLTGAIGTPTPITADPGVHVEDMRFFYGRLYATSRNGILLELDPETGAMTEIITGIGRSQAMEVFEP